MIEVKQLRKTRGIIAAAIVFITLPLFPIAVPIIYGVLRKINKIEKQNLLNYIHIKKKESPHSKVGEEVSSSQTENHPSSQAEILSQIPSLPNPGTSHTNSVAVKPLGPNVTLIMLFSKNQVVVKFQAHKVYQIRRIIVLGIRKITGYSNLLLFDFSLSPKQ